MKKIERESLALQEELNLPPAYGGYDSDKAVLIRVLFKENIEQILQNEQSDQKLQKKRKKPPKRTFKEMVKNQQEML